LYLCFRIVRVLRTVLLYCAPAQADFVRFADGGFALITGGAGGIGKATAHEFAKLGINLYLVDFDGGLLGETEKELRKLYPNILIKTKTIDLRILLQKDEYEKFSKEINLEKVGILFNCAGIAEYKTYRFCRNSHEEMVSLSAINITVPLLLYHAVLPQMVKRRNGLMLAMSSASAVSAQPLLPHYGASKSYILQLSQCLQEQFPFQYSGICFHAFHPQFIHTPMTANKLGKKSAFSVPDVNDWVRAALKTVQSPIHDGHSAGNLPHEWLIWIQMNVLPLMQAMGRKFSKPTHKYDNDPRFENCVCHQENGIIFRDMIKLPHAFNDAREKKGL